MSIKIPSKKDLSKIISALKADSKNTTIDWKTFIQSGNQNYFKELSQIDYSSLLEELEKDKANNKVRGEIERLCM